MAERVRETRCHTAARSLQALGESSRSARSARHAAPALNGSAVRSFAVPETISAPASEAEPPLPDLRLAGLYAALLAERARRESLRHPEDPEAAAIAREARALVVHWSDGDDLNESHDDDEDEDR